jgi:hypothetical protein
MTLNGLVKRSRDIFLDILTFSYPIYRVLFFLGVLFFLLIIPVHILELGPNFSICSFILGEYCYSTGITRGVASLLKGNISEAIDYNFLSIPVLAILFLFIIVDLYMLKRR